LCLALAVILPFELAAEELDRDALNALENYIKSGSSHNYTKALLLVSKLADPKFDIANIEKTLDGYAEVIRDRIKSATTNRERAAIISQYLFFDTGFEPRSMLLGPLKDRTLANVVFQKAGNCFGLSQLYACLAEKVGLHCDFITVPRHSLLRCKDGSDIFYIETTLYGAIQNNLVNPEKSNTDQFQVEDIHEVVASALLQTIETSKFYTKDKISSPLMQLTMSLDPKQPSLYLRRADVLASMRKEREAIADYKMALTLYREKKWSVFYQSRAAIGCNDSVVLVSILQEYPLYAVIPDNPSINNPLIHGAKSIDVLRTLLKYGADVNSRGLGGVTPLHAAAYSNRVEIGDYLLNAGAVINETALEGITPLHVAAETGSIEFIRLLSKRGCDLNLITKAGHTALNFAIATRQSASLATLLELGASANVLDLEQRSPLYWSANYGMIDMMKLLLEHGSALNQLNKDGLNALHSALNANHFEAALFLLDSGIENNIADNKGITPAKICEQKLKTLVTVQSD